MNQSLSTFNELFDLVYVGKLPTLKSTIEKFNDFDVTALCDLSGRSLLDLAVALDKVEFVRYFLEIGADINTSNNDQPPIHHAKSMEMMKLLLDYGANVDYIPEKTVTLLFTKVNQGKTDQALLLLDHGADMYPIESVDGDNILLYACSQKGKFELVRTLVERGVDINVTNEDGITPLLAAIASHLPVEVIEYLVNHGADVYHTAKCGKNALMLALIAKHKEVITYLLELDFPVNKISIHDRKTTLHYAIGCGECAEAAVRKLLQRGANVNAVSKDGSAALHRAAFNGFTALAAILLENGALVDLKNESGTTALMFAVEKAHINTIHLLLDHKADPCSKDNFGKSAHHMALERDVQDILLNPRKRKKTFNVNRA